MNPTLPVIVLGAALTVLSAVQAWLLWRLSKMVAASARLEEKVGHLGDALSILTETSEAGFKAIADELTRQSVPAAPASRAKTPASRTDWPRSTRCPNWYRTRSGANCDTSACGWRHCWPQRPNAKEAIRSFHVRWPTRTSSTRSRNTWDSNHSSGRHCSNAKVCWRVATA